MTFESLSKIKIMNIMFLIIEEHNNVTFIFFINDHMRSVKFFDEMFNFLYFKYFFRIAFNSIYLLNYKIYMFINSFEMIKFIDNLKNLRFFVKHHKRVMHWKESINREELNIII